MEPLNENKPRLTGAELRARLSELEKMIREEHRESKIAWCNALEHARNAGEWLIEAKWRKGHRLKWGRWKRWFAKEYNISERTISQYMQIARYWDDPRIIETRQQGIEINSISGFLRVLRSQHPKQKQALSQKEENRIQNCKRIRMDFAMYLQGLDKFEVEILRATFNDMLENFNADLRSRVCGNYESYYDAREKVLANSDVSIAYAGPPSGRCKRKRRQSRLKKSLNLAE